jgi:hypothetical protein
MNTSSPERRKLALDGSTPSGGPSSPSSTSSLSSILPKNNDDYNDPQLVIAGKISVEDAPCNIGQYNLRTKKWSLTECIQLSLYNSYSGGEVYSLLANHTTKKVRMDEQQLEQQQSSSAYGLHPNR